MIPELLWRPDGVTVKELLKPLALRREGLTLVRVRLLDPLKSTVPALLNAGRGVVNLVWPSSAAKPALRGLRHVVCVRGLHLRGSSSASLRAPQRRPWASHARPSPTTGSARQLVRQFRGVPSRSVIRASSARVRAGEKTLAR